MKTADFIMENAQFSSAKFPFEAFSPHFWQCFSFGLIIVIVVVIMCSELCWFVLAQDLDSIFQDFTLHTINFVDTRIVAIAAKYTTFASKVFVRREMKAWCLACFSSFFVGIAGKEIGFII